DDAPPRRFEDLPAVASAAAVGAFDARAGADVWTFSALGDGGAADGGRRAVPVTIDVDRALVYAVFGADPSGGDEESRFAGSVVALDARSGEPKWSFRTGRDGARGQEPAAPPLLVDVRRRGRTVPALVVLTARGDAFVLNRVTGAPVLGGDERPPERAAVGTTPAPAQPAPLAPPPLARRELR